MALLILLFLFIVLFGMAYAAVSFSRRKLDSTPCDWTCPKCNCEIDKRMESEHPLGNCRICGYDLRAGRSSLRVRLWRRWAPELELFLPHERERALFWDPGDRLPPDRQTTRSIVAISIPYLIAFLFLPDIVINALSLPPLVGLIIRMVLIFGVFLWVVWLARRRVSRSFRQQLIDAGFTICEPCGYNLHGLTEYRCPECGAPFSGLSSCPGCGGDVLSHETRCPRCDREIERES